MSTNTKTRSALREALKHEDAALADRIPDAAAAAAASVAEEKPASATPPASAAADVSVATVAKVDAPAKARARAPAKPAAKASTKTAAKAGAKTSAEAATPKTVVAEPANVEAKAAPTRKSPHKAVTAAAEAKAEPAKKAHAKREPENTEHAKKPKSEKVVRDSFSMPASEHAGIKSLRIALGKAGRLASKSEVLRAGLKVLGERSVADVLAVLDGLPVADKGKRKKH
ncbi:hypothetical protein [Azoarcus sp. DN11]|uniref:hypothetical protein n=1 Tax=Azoarcus sp. DN11 TaxID=356837 RepID=UPI000EB06B26|nr:hypothetical protein [Azoarcus sp. DN11]AYH43373.1 hypothetical protein CDA09_08250 [Azoarcus sp. DN11]